MGTPPVRLEGCRVTEHNCLHVLLEDEPRRDQPTVPRTKENNHTIRVTEGSSVKTTWKIEMRFAHLKHMLRLVGFDYVAHGASEMSLFALPSPRTCDNLHRWSRDRQPLCVFLRGNEYEG